MAGLGDLLEDRVLQELFKNLFDPYVIVQLVDSTYMIALLEFPIVLVKKGDTYQLPCPIRSKTIEAGSVDRIHLISPANFDILMTTDIDPSVTYKKFETVRLPGLSLGYSNE